jgi:cbb3-type cytochrome oxidase maturation protein
VGRTAVSAEDVVSILFIVLPLAILLVGAAVAAFVWAARQGQFDDTRTPAVRMLHDDAEARPEPTSRP